MTAADREDRQTRIAAMAVVADLHRRLGLLINAAGFALSQLEQADRQIGMRLSAVHVNRAVAVLSTALDEVAEIHRHRQPPRPPLEDES